MKNRFVTVCALLLALALSLPAMVVLGGSPVYAEAVARIVVEGNQRVETETILTYVSIKPGSQADDAQLDDAVKSLFQTGLFSDVQVLHRGSTLVIQVKENPMVNRVLFEGNDEIKTDVLQKEVQLRERMVFTRAKEQNDIERITTLYRRKGFYNLVVTPRQVPLSENRIDLVYKINEGTETHISDIKFVGNSTFSSGDLLGVINSRIHTWWNIFGKNDTYDPDRLELDKELLRRYYLQTGFADVKIISAEAQPDGDEGNYIITFTIEEGGLYTVGDVSVNRGSTTLDEGALKEAVILNPGDDFDASRLNTTIENLTLEAGRQGYAFADIQPDLKKDPATHILTITYNITEGPRTYIERIDIVGNLRTRDDVIRRELDLYEGDAFNRVMVDRARRKLTALDFFEKIDFKEEQGSAPDRVILVIEVAEKSTGSISFSAGYSTTDTILGGINLSERNLMGRGIDFNINTQLSFKRQEIDLSITEPYFMDMPISAGFDVFATRSDEESHSGYRSGQYGSALRSGFNIDQYSALDFKYSITRRRVYSVDDKSAWAIRQSKGVSWKSAIGANYTWDDLDNPLNPTKGFRGQFRSEIAGLGGDAKFISTEASAWWFRPLFVDGIILKLEGNAGNLFSLDGKHVRVEDRYFKGGDSFRGFKPSGVGPRMKNGHSGRVDSIGGQTYAIGTMEVTFPVGLPAELGVTGAAFSDFGTLFNSHNKTRRHGDDCSDDKPCTVWDTTKFRMSVGAGLIWQSPFGPLRVDLAYPLLKAHYDKKEIFRFSMGTRF